MEPLISVIVPIYNGQDYLEKCIISIEEQSYENLEIIIVNDGSTDNTAALCVRLRETYDNIRVITTEDEGVSAARNAGIDAAKGVFITFVDADDRLRPKMLQVLYHCILDTGCDVAGCSFFKWSKEEEWQQFLLQRYRIEKAEKTVPLKYLREQVMHGNSRCWSKLYRRSVIGNFRFQQNLSIGEDMLFLVRLLPYVNGIAETNYPGYGYYRNPKGAMNRDFTPKYMDQITCWELAREEIGRMDKELTSSVTTILIMSIMLTAGKIAMLPFGQRWKNRKYSRLCHEKLKTELQTPGACEGLSKGYKVKTRIFRIFPELYLTMYHFRKYLP